MTRKNTDLIIYVWLASLQGFGCDSILHAVMWHGSPLFCHPVHTYPEVVLLAANCLFVLSGPFKLSLLGHKKKFVS